MALAAVPDPQTSIEERVIEDADLVELLDKRQALKLRLSDLRGKYAEADEAAKAHIAEKHDLKDGEVVRVGWFRISKKATPARDVSFTTSPSSRVTIAKLEDS